MCGICGVWTRRERGERLPAGHVVRRARGVRARRARCSIARVKMRAAKVEGPGWIGRLSPQFGRYCSGKADFHKPALHAPPVELPADLKEKTRQQTSEQNDETRGQSLHDASPVFAELSVLNGVAQYRKPKDGTGSVTGAGVWWDGWRRSVMQGGMEDQTERVLLSDLHSLTIAVTILFTNNSISVCPITSLL